MTSVSAAGEGDPTWIRHSAPVVVPAPATVPRAAPAPVAAAAPAKLAQRRRRPTP